MLSKRRFKEDEEGIVFTTLMAILGFAILLAGGILALLAVQMIVQNILPIGIVIVLILVLPIVAKGWYYKKTGKDYKSEGKK